MEEILVVIGQLLIDFFLQVGFYTAVRGPLAAWRPVPANFVLLVVGGVLGALSLLVFRFTLIDWPSLRIANLVVAPVAAGFLFRGLAKRRARKSYSVVPREHFWHAFWFTLGWVVVRFLWARRG
jgi:hypothetical protein